MSTAAERHVFQSTGEDFSAVNAAEKWCEDNGISVGSMQSDSPRGLLRGEFIISKWRNLRDKEREELDGRMIGDMRHGPVVVEMFI